VKGEQERERRVKMPGTPLRKLPYIDVLVVAEKHTVAKAIANILAEGRIFREYIYGVPAYFFSRKNRLWCCLGLKGHLLDFDFEEAYNSWKQVDPRTLFFVDPVKVIRPENLRYVHALQTLGRRAREVILALDADVEGEAIAFEVVEIVKRVNPHATFKRAWFSALTREDILTAFENLRKPNPLFANKVFSRMIIDLTIGAAFTRLLTLAVERNRFKLPRGMFLSYGPCQSPVLFLVVKRALERENFQKKKYYTLIALIEKEGIVYKAEYTGEKIYDKEKAEKLYKELSREKEAEVVQAKYSKVSVKPPIPLNTIDLERDCSKFLDIRAKETLSLAEKLYQHGLISYPRTETTIYPPTLNLRKIASLFSSHPIYGPYVSSQILLKPVIVPTKGRDDDKAHPPIYPIKSVQLDYVRKTLGGKACKIYDYVVRRFLATLSDPAFVEKQLVIFRIGGLNFKITGIRVLDEGFYKIYPFGRPSEKPLAYFKVGERTRILSIKLVQRTTPPPPYLSEAELLRLMRVHGIGTDATMQEHIHTNIKRKYFLIRGKKCIPTKLGKSVALTLSEIVPEIVSPEVRGKIESWLTQISEGKADPAQIVKEVKEQFLQYFDKLRKNENYLAEKLIKALVEMNDEYAEDIKGRESSRRAYSGKGTRSRRSH